MVAPHVLFMFFFATRSQRTALRHPILRALRLVDADLAI
ncbi:hypothetical protein FP2506_11617 [Fulvimarina pelagi HTCC2506]|uniref:Uncharacterized protein n=1 Tax=Fulvimarina pelagi HTCC2506 TaxID=314231 RepID=Q0FYV6_9HYPH|nr:hypothetical protein FP2506_11617 [Fulvimarina pelagi HTCC2506]